MSLNSSKTILLCLLAFLVFSLKTTHSTNTDTTTSALSPYWEDVNKLTQKGKKGVVVDIITSQQPIFSKTSYMAPELTFAKEYKRLHPKDKVRVFVPIKVQNRKGNIGVNSIEWQTLLSYFKQVRRVDKPCDRIHHKLEPLSFPLNPHEIYSNVIYPGSAGIKNSYFSIFEATDENDNKIELYICSSMEMTAYRDHIHALDLWEKINAFTKIGDITVMVGDENLRPDIYRRDFTQEANNLLEVMEQKITKPHTLASVGQIGQRYPRESKQSGNILCLALEQGKDIDVVPYFKKDFPQPKEKARLRRNFLNDFRILRQFDMYEPFAKLLTDPDCVWAFTSTNKISNDPITYTSSMFLNGVLEARKSQKNLKSVLLISERPYLASRIHIDLDGPDWVGKIFVSDIKQPISVYFNEKLQLAVIATPFMPRDRYNSLIRATDISGLEGEEAWAKAFKFGTVHGGRAQKSSHLTFRDVYKRANRHRAAQYLDDWHEASYNYMDMKYHPEFKHEYIDSHRALIKSLTSKIALLFMDKSFRDEFKLGEMAGVKSLSSIRNAHTNFADKFYSQATRKSA